jgi:hypothetical protein
MKLHTLLSALIGITIHTTFSAQNAVLFHDETDLSKATAEFNSIASRDNTGKTEPALSPDEVVASIRGIMFDRLPPIDPVYKKLFQQIADTRRLPANSSLSFTTEWTGYNGYDFHVWWIDLFINPTDPSKLPPQLRLGYNFRIRNRFISSTSHK